MRFRDRIARFFYGRNGFDQFSRFLTWITLSLLLLSMIFNRFINATVGSVFWIAGMLTMIYYFFRTLSKNIYKRQLENQRYLRFSGRIRSWLSLQHDRLKFRKDYAFFTCPSCRTVLRVPKGKGKIKIKCQKCGEMFIRKT